MSQKGGVGFPCSNGVCGKRGSQSCTRRWCKACCAQDKTFVCKSSDHRPPKKFSTSSDPYHFPRPVPTVPLRLPPSPSMPPILEPPLPPRPDSEDSTTTPPTTQPTTARATRDYSKVVPPAWREQIEQKERARTVRIAHQAQRAFAELAINHSVVLCLLRDLGATRDIFPLQSIATWPTLRLVDIPGLVERLGVASLADLEYHAGFFRATPLRYGLDVFMEVKKGQIIDLRHKGELVDSVCLCEPTLVATPVPTTPSPLTPTMVCSKRSLAPYGEGIGHSYIR